MTKTLRAIYPGTFDPVTIGHIDMIRRALKVADHLIIGIASNKRKNPLFTDEERVRLIQNDLKAVGDLPQDRIEVIAFECLLMKFAEEQKADILIRGLRAFTDFDYEFQMAGMNARLNQEIETVFLMASEQYQFISSRFVKEVCSLGGDVTKFVSKSTAEALRLKFKNYKNLS